MSGYKEFQPQDILTATDVQSFLMDQSTLVFDDAADRDAQVTTPTEGMRAYLKDTKGTQEYNGASWLNLGKAVQQTVVERTAIVSNASSVFVVCDEIVFTPLYANSTLLLEWFGNGSTGRASGSPKERSMFCRIFDATNNVSIDGHELGIELVSGSSSEAGADGVIYVRGVAPSVNTTARTYQTQIRSTTLGTVSTFSKGSNISGGANRFQITEYVPGPLL